MIPLGRSKNEPPRRLGTGSLGRGTTSLVGRGPNGLPSSITPQTFDEEYTLRLIPSIKKYNIARFNDGEMPTLAKCVQPIKMFHEPEKIRDDEEEKKEEPQGWNPALRKKRRRRRKDTRMKNWVIQENDSKTLFTGTVEGGVTSSYMLMVKTPNKNEFQVFPVEDWFRFKKPLNYRTLTLEEAEDMNNEKKRAVERWIMKMEKKEGEVAPTTTMITGALRTVKSEDKDESSNIFAEPKAPRRRGPVAKKSAEVDATGDDGGDFTEIFSDDEGQAEVEKVKDEIASESSDGEYEDGANKKALTAEGKALEDLVKRTKEQSENPTADTGNADKDDSDEEEKSASENTVVKYDFYGNPVKETVVAAPDEANGAPAAEADIGKRKAEGEDNRTDKKARTNPPAKPPSSSKAAPKLTEALIQEELIRYGGRMKTKELLKKLKKLLVTADDKAMFKDIVRTICDVEEDPIDGRFMVLKPQFR
ncbi:unnamed protein product [Aphanomyces euteiches]|uniref:Transcription initiation factor IIF subunit alpha n=1 Tax=Aphanomyces euteiches TaxID=100861 RepID=A0A6G0WZG9_9STRA|nr:hypothetical protein Ae201684_010070 [Aphanomyces euteiches]KAH9099469.1 hypothetical protein Ae201684P_018484 [Aphanomyces euteiches]KAH9134110.1 hypothetical protein AeRB84_020003 [Aphanomyces euteiches]